MSARRVIGWATAGALVALMAAIGVSTLGDRNAGDSELVAGPATPEQIARGEYLARLGDCAACHSVPSAPPFSGGLRMGIPIGAIYTTNITPDPTFGIGRFTLADFDRALRFGVSRGHTLYPAMPYTSYNNTTPEDVAALYAYFRNGVKAAAIPNRSNEIQFPLSMRWPLTYWRWLFAPRPVPFAAPASLSADAARGQYFVEGLGHCGECHTPRGVTLAVRAATAGDGVAFLSGTSIENYFAPSLRNDGPGTLADWSTEELAEFLRTGANRHGIAFASMTDVIVHSTQYLTPADARAAAVFLKTLKSPDSESAVAFTPDAATHAALRSGDVSKPGAQLYLDNCAACHRPDGAGYERVFPPIAGNPVVQAGNAQSVISIVLRGSRTPRTDSTPAQFVMPALGWRLSDREVAEVVTFVRSSWGNRASGVSASAVREARASLGLPREEPH